MGRRARPRRPIEPATPVVAGKGGAAAGGARADGDADGGARADGDGDADEPVRATKSSYQPARVQLPARTTTGCNADAAKHLCWCGGHQRRAAPKSTNSRHDDRRNGGDGGPGNARSTNCRTTYHRTRARAPAQHSEPHGGIAHGCSASNTQSGSPGASCGGHSQQLPRHGASRHVRPNYGRHGDCAYRHARSPTCWGRHGRHDCRAYGRHGDCAYRHARSPNCRTTYHRNRARAPAQHFLSHGGRALGCSCALECGGCKSRSVGPSQPCRSTTKYGSCRDDRHDCRCYGHINSINSCAYRHARSPNCRTTYHRTRARAPAQHSEPHGGKAHGCSACNTQSGRPGAGCGGHSQQLPRHGASRHARPNYGRHGRHDCPPYGRHGDCAYRHARSPNCRTTYHRNRARAPAQHFLSHGGRALGCSCALECGGCKSRSVGPSQPCRSTTKYWRHGYYGGIGRQATQGDDATADPGCRPGRPTFTRPTFRFTTQEAATHHDWRPASGDQKAEAGEA